MLNESKDFKKFYDDNILAEGREYQIERYYEPKEVYNQRRISIVLEKLAPRKNERVLDIGCGVGTFAFHSSKTGAVVYGVDYSFESIKMAKNLVERYNTPIKAKFVVADATKIPFGDSSFDKIISADFIEHISYEEKDNLLKEIYRLLKPGGAGAIFSPNATREKIGNIYWRLRNKIFGDKIPYDVLHFGLTNKYAFEAILKKHQFKFKLVYEDTTRPFLARIPLLRNFLALYLLWMIKKS
ncbi:MAG: class I SAM-dependent methyltransferase [Candidatus Omnitrophica bacterium]|nr:class I SAM-dependent methyltransferase [Candidatus Omnitrophota bacterium]